MMRAIQMESDRISCLSAMANQVRLVLHIGACWLMLSLRIESHAITFASEKIRVSSIHSVCT